MALARAGRHDRAIAEWRETVRLAPTLWPARIGLAKALLASGDPGEAAAQCREVLKQEPGAVEAIAILGTPWLPRAKSKKQSPTWSEPWKLDPRNARAHFQVALALSRSWAVAECHRASQRGNSSSARRCPDVVAGGLDSGDESRSVGSRWSAGGRTGQPSDRAFRRPRGRAPSMRSPPRWPKPRSSPRPSRQPSMRRRWPWPAATPRWPTPSTQRTRLYRQGLPYRQPASRCRLARPADVPSKRPLLAMLNSPASRCDNRHSAGC